MTGSPVRIRRRTLVVGLHDGDPGVEILASETMRRSLVSPALDLSCPGGGWLEHKLCYCAAVRNLTVSVPDDVYRNARVAAAQRDTSVSALVVAYLERLSGRMSEFARLEALQREVQAEIGQFRADDRRAATRSTTVQFVDTNVLLYAISRDPAERGQAKRANDISLQTRSGSIRSGAAGVLRTGDARQPPGRHPQAGVRLIESFRRFPVQDITTAYCWRHWTPASASSSPTGTRRSSKPRGPWAALMSCPKTSTTAKIMPASRSPTRFANVLGRLERNGLLAKRRRTSDDTLRRWPVSWPPVEVGLPVRCQGAERSIRDAGLARVPKRPRCRRPGRR